MVDIKEIKGYFDHGKLNAYPTKRKKQIIALAWISEHIPADRTYSEKEFNALLSELHSFGDPALLRRELYDHYMIRRSIEGKEYMLDPNRPSLEELLLNVEVWGIDVVIGHAVDDILVRERRGCERVLRHRRHECQHAREHRQGQQKGQQPPSRRRIALHG